jgi:hypothetical protein
MEIRKFNILVFLDSLLCRFKPVHCLVLRIYLNTVIPRLRLIFFLLVLCRFLFPNIIG